MKLRVGLSLAVLLLVSTVASAASLTVTMYLTAAPGKQGAEVGTITATDTQYGMLLTPHLKGLPPGIHGFHVHVNPSCANEGQAAGGHLDPAKTGMHLGPYDAEGHLGDLPALTVNAQGEATLPILAPRLKVTMLQGHALMIHADGDNYSDQPAALGGGGARLACGVVKSDAVVSSNRSSSTTDSSGSAAADSSGNGATNSKDD